MPSPPVFEYDHWRIRTDSISSTSTGATPTWGCDLNASSGYTAEIGSEFRLVIALSETAGNASNNETIDLEYRLNTTGTWTAVQSSVTEVSSGTGVALETIQLSSIIEVSSAFFAWEGYTGSTGQGTYSGVSRQQRNRGGL